MQKNNKSYNFLLSHSSKNRIFIKRIEVSKKVLNITSFSGLLIIFVFLSLGIFGLVKNTSFAKSILIPENQEGIISQSSTQNQPQQEQALPKLVNYSNPNSMPNFGFNSGGPDGDFQLTTESEEEENRIEEELKRIEMTLDRDNLPMIWAHSGKINNEFGYRRNPFGGRTYEFHGGMDIDGEKGDTVIAPGGGIIIKAGWEGGYGYMIEIDHGLGLTTRYGHLSKIEVAVGDIVRRGQLIGLVGSTGRSTGPHLHYELRLNDKTINPRRFLPPEPVDINKK